MFKPTTFVDMKSFNMFAFHWFVNILSKQLSCGVISGHRNHVGL